jgi:transcription factor SFP1
LVVIESMTMAHEQYHYLNSGEHGEYGLNMLANQTHPMPKEHGQPVKRPTMSSLSSQITNSRPSAAPYHIPNHHGNNNANSQNKPGMPRMGVWPSKPNAAAPSKLNPALNAPKPTPAPPRPDALTGADAVLYTNLGSSDPMDIMARME